MSVTAVTEQTVEQAEVTMASLIAARGRVAAARVTTAGRLSIATTGRFTGAAATATLVAKMAEQTVEQAVATASLFAARGRIAARRFARIATTSGLRVAAAGRLSVAAAGRLAASRLAPTAVAVQAEHPVEQFKAEALTTQSDANY